MKGSTVPVARSPILDVNINRYRRGSYGGMETLGWYTVYADDFDELQCVRAHCAVASSRRDHVQFKIEFSGLRRYF